MVARGLVMKSNRQLNHTLKMPTHGPVARQGAPDVFKDFMGIEKLGAVEQIDAFTKIKALVVKCHVMTV